MQDKIKMVYSWIGPKGPVWNTELPNILSFSSVAEGVQPDSRHFWCEGTWHTLCANRQHLFEAYPAFGITEDDTRPFIVPFSLTWRIAFTHYFCGRTGILEFAHLPWHLVRLVRDSNGYILIDHSVEAFMSDQELKAMHGYFSGIHALPLNKIMYLTGTINAVEVYNDFCERHGIPDSPDERLTVIPYPSSLDIFSRYVEQGTDEPVYNTGVVPEKLFLMWNRRYRRHRVELTLALENKNLIDRSYVSFSDVDIENPSMSFSDSVDEDYLVHINYGLDITPDDIARFKSKLPLVIDGETDVTRMCEDFDNAARPYFQNSLVSIVTETNWDASEITLTEKSFKPIKEKHPFIIVGVKGVLKGMRDLGFKTFSDFWDESYDDIDCPQQRLVAIAAICEEIGSWSPEKILDFRRKVSPILTHNWNLLSRPVSDVTVNVICDHIRRTIK